MITSAARLDASDLFVGRSIWIKRASRSIHGSFAQTRSHRYDVRCPLGFGGFPALPTAPRLNGRNRVAVPANFVVMETLRGSAAKWTSARRASVTFFGLRSVRYWLIALSRLGRLAYFLRS